MVAAITRDPIIGPVGTVVEIVGSGFDALSLMAFTFDGNVIVPNEGATTTDVTGAFDIHLTIPSSTHGAKAIVATDAGAHSDSQNFTVQTVPAAPVISLLSKGLTNLHVQWTVPNDGDSALTGYVLEWCLASDNFSPLVGTTSPGAGDTDFDITSLTNGVSYKSRIRAVNAIGESDNSNTLTATPATAPSAPAAPTAVAISDTAIDVSWVAPAANGSPITGYKVESNVNGGGYTTLVADTGTTAVIYHDTGLTTGDSVVYKISAINAEGTSAASSASNAAVTWTVTDPPVATSATAVSDTQIDLVWVAPVSDGGTPVTGYKIERKIGVGAYSTLVADTGNDDVTYSDTTLTTGQLGTYKISAINAVGTSAASNEVSDTTFTVPAAPVLTLSTVTDISLRVTCPAPADGDSVILSYTFEISLAADNFSPILETKTNLGAGAQDVTFEGLIQQTSYKIRARATNAIGDSVNSNIITQSTDKTITQMTMAIGGDFGVTIDSYESGKIEDVAVTTVADMDIVAIPMMGLGTLLLHLKNPHTANDVTYTCYGTGEQLASPRDFDTGVWEAISGATGTSQRFKNNNDPLRLGIDTS